MQEIDNSNSEYSSGFVDENLLASAAQMSKSRILSPEINQQQVSEKEKQNQIDQIQEIEEIEEDISTNNKHQN